MKAFSLALIVVMATAVGGCVVRGDVGARGYVYAPAPHAELVYVSPGVYVIADYHEPIFYSDSYYWLYRDGYWYRSGYYTGGWVRVYSPPHVVASIRTPSAYVRYRGDGYARVRARDHRGGPASASYRQAPQGQVRDHRAPPSSGTVRDHRKAEPTHAPPARGNSHDRRTH